MSLLGIRLNLLIGPTVPLPAPALLTTALDTVEVMQSDTSPTGFQITFRAGRDRLTGALNYELLNSPLLQPFSRVIITMIVNVTPHILIDGIITHQQVAPASEGSEALITVTGEDVSVMMDLEEKIVSHPVQNDFVIAEKIILSYSQYGLLPEVIPPPVLDQPTPFGRVPIQHGTDLGYLKQMAARYGYVFYVQPGSIPLTNVAYWGPPKRVSVPQPALTVNMETATNVDSFDFQYSALTPTTVWGKIQDSLSNQTETISITNSTRVPALASAPALRRQSRVRQTLLTNADGLSRSQAEAHAQGRVNVSTDDVIIGTGELDVMRYQHVLRAPGLVGVRGVGNSYDGIYYVKQVTHLIQSGQYRQRFTVTREGMGTLTPEVIP